MTKITLSAALAAVVAGPALAGGLADPAPVIAPVAPAPVVMAPSADWTGFYLGGSIGTATVSGILDGDGDGLGDDDTGLSDDDDTPFDLDGNTYGLHAGYLYDLGTVVVGGELDYARLDLDDTEVTVDSTDFGGSFDTTVDGGEADVMRLKGRVGYDAGSFLPYVTAGVAKITSDEDNFDLDENGVVYGAGADFAVTDNILVGAEYLRHDFEDANLEADTMSLRASFKF